MYLSYLNGIVNKVNLKGTSFKIGFSLFAILLLISSFFLFSGVFAGETTSGGNASKISLNDLKDISKYEVSDVKIGNKKAKKIMFPKLNKSISIKNKNFKLIKTKYFGDAEIKLMEKVNVTKQRINRTYKCNCVNKTINQSINQTKENKTIEKNKTIKNNIIEKIIEVCKTCYIYENYTVEEMREINPENVLKKNKPIYELKKKGLKIVDLPDGKYGYSVYTNVSVLGVEIKGATFWNSSWSYRMQTNISNTAGDLSDYQVKIELNSSNFNYSHANTTGKDIRFTNSTDDLIDYWIEEWNTSGSSYIWVKIPFLENATNTTIYMYYGNDGANSESDSSFLINNLLSYYTFDKYSGTTFIDSMNYKNGAESGTITKDQTGVIGECYYFNNGVIDRGLDGIVYNKGTISIWYYPDDYTPSATGGIWEHNVDKDRLYLVHNADGSIQFAYMDNPEAVTYTLTSNKWYHIVATWNQSNWYLYVDGSLRDSGSGATPISFSTSHSWGYGKVLSTNDRPIYGKEDESGIWTEPLTLSQIQELYNNGNGYVMFADIEPTVSIGSEETSGDTTPPTSNQPSDASYTQNSAQTIEWILQDETGAGNYTVYRNGTIQNSSTSWTNNTNLGVWVNTSTIGNNWNYTIYFNDSAGNEGTPDTVFINITECSVNSDCGLCEKCSAYSCVNQLDSEDLKSECSASYNTCSNNYTRQGPDGYCDGAGACDTDDALLNVSAGNVCDSGSDTNPTMGINCGTWSDCTADACSASEYWVGYAGDGTATCVDTDWQSASSTYNVPDNYIISATNKQDTCDTANTGKSPSYTICSNNWTRQGADGYCDGSGSLDTNDALTNVSAGNVCFDGTDANPNATRYCGLWGNCITGNVSADEYYIGYAGDGTETCSDTDWQASSTYWNTTAGYTIDTTEHADTCSESDITPPAIILNTTASDENSVVNRNWSYQEAYSDENLNGSKLNWNGTNETATVSGMRCYLNKTNLADGNYTYKLWVNDSIGNWNSTDTYWTYVDTTYPLIDFDSGTETNNTFLNQNWIYVNWTYIETNLANITAEIFNSTGDSINQTTFISAIYEINWTLIDQNELYYYNITICDSASNCNNTETRVLTLDDTDPSVTDINWITTGGFTDDTLIYNQILDWVAVTASDTNLKEVNITVYDPDNTPVNNQAMTNSTSTNWNYTSDITLNKAGTWNITIIAYDYANNSKQNSTTFSVTTQNLSSKDGWYGCTRENISSSSEIITFANYDCDLLEIEDNITTLATNWNSVLTAINNSKDNNMRVGLNYLLDFDYNSSSEKTSALENISATFSDLTGDPYSDVVEYISFELVNPSSYNDSTKYTTLNDLAENATGEFSNKFVVYSKNYNSNLDNSYISYTKMIYLEETTQAGLINTENSLLKYNSSLNRVYVDLSSTLMAQTQIYQKNILGKLRGFPKTDSIVGNPKIAEIDTVVNDFVVFNNQSSSQNISVDITNITGYLGKEAWDETNGLLSDNNTDGTFDVLVSGYYATMVFLEDLDHIQMTSNSESSVYKGGVSNTQNFNYTNDTKDGSWTLYGANDARIELFDPHYKMNNYITYYGWINCSYITNWSAYDIIIFDDETTDAVSTLLSKTTTTDLYCYISVGDYNNSDAWSNAKETEVDDCIALNSSTRLNVFIDGMDIGIGGTNFSSRMKDLVDYVKITKDRKIGLNTYTAYEDFCSWSQPDGFCMKESCVRRWNGVNSANPDNYTFENWNLELEKSKWYQSHNINVLCQAFDNRTRSDSSQQITNRTRMEDIYFASLILGYDYFYLSQPDFNYAHTIYLYNAGKDLANTYSTNDNETYYRAYSNGIVYYNSSSHKGWIDDGRDINKVEVCMKLIDNSDNVADEDDDFCFNVNKNNDNSCDYEFTASEVTWSANGIWYCKNLSIADIPTDSGAYYINAWMKNRGLPADGISLSYDSNIEGTGRHTWWDNTAGGEPYNWNAYAQDQNWMVRVSVNETKKISIDTTDKITQSETTLGSYTNVSLTSPYDFNMEIWSDFVTVDLTDFVGLKYYNGTEFITIYPEYNSDCDSNNPTFNSTTISGEIHKACYKDTGFRVAPPSLSTRTYQAQSDITPPTYSDNSTNSTDKGDILHSLKWTDETGLSGYIFQFCNGTWNGTDCTGGDETYTLKEYYNTNDDTQGAIYNNGWWGQTFNTSVSYDIKTIGVKVFKVGNPETVTISIYPTNATGEPDCSGSPLVTGNFNGSLVTTSTPGEWVNVTFSSAYTLAASTTYAITMNLTGDASNYIDWRLDSSSATYAGGTKGSSNDGGTTWSMDANYDMMFETYASSSSGTGWQNDSWVSFPTGGTEDWSNVTKTVTEINIAWCVYANDTSNNWNNSCASPFTYIANTEPSVSSITISPSTAYTNNNLECNTTITDIELGDNLTVYFKWYHNGTLNETGSFNPITNGTNTLISTLGSGNTTKGDEWICEITPYDSIENGTPLNSSLKTISNSVPVITTLLTSISVNANGTSWSYDYNATDADGDTLTWYDNTTFFNINSSTGIINDTPTENETGSYEILINVSDGTSQDTDLFTYQINDTIPPNCTLISQTPNDINSSSTGSITILYNCTDTNGINDSRIAIATTVNHTTDGNLNFSWRFPSNTMAGGEYNEQRAEHRGKGDWFESLFPNVWEWSVHDNDCGHISIVDSGSGWKVYNITKSDIHGLFHQYIPVDKKTLETTGTDALGFYKNNPIITEIHYRNINADSVMQLVFYINGTNSNKDSLVYYCNETKKNDGLSIENSENCVYLGSIGTIDSYEYTKDNVSYYKIGFYIDENETIGHVKVSEISYFAFVTSASSLKAWDMGYSDDTNLIGNISMNNSKMLFTSSDDGIAFTQHNGTGVAWLSEVHNNTDKITYKMYSCDNLSNCGWNEVTTDEIGIIQYAPEKPQIIHIDGDSNKNGSYDGTINIGCILGEDENGDPVTGNLTLRNTDGTWNYTVNETFSDSGLEINVSFNSSLVIDGIYKLNLTNCDNTSRCSSILDTNFTIDNTNPLIEYNPTTTSTGNHSQDWIFINITASDTNKDTILFEWNGTNETFDNSSGNIYWENKTGLSDGTYTIKAYINDTAGNTNETLLRTMQLDTTPPSIIILSPIAYNSYNNNLVIDTEITDLSNISYAYYNITSSTNLTITGELNLSNNWDAILDTTTVIDGNYFLSIWANDTVGNENNKRINFTIDNTNPQILNFTISKNSIKLGNSITIVCYASDNLGDVNINLTRNDVLIKTCYSSPCVSTYTPTSTGTKTLKCTAYDDASNYNTSTKLLTVNSEPSGSTGGESSYIPLKEPFYYLTFYINPINRTEMEVYNDKNELTMEKVIHSGRITIPLVKGKYRLKIMIKGYELYEVNLLVEKAGTYNINLKEKTMEKVEEEVKEEKYLQTFKVYPSIIDLEVYKDDKLLITQKLRSGDNISLPEGEYSVILKAEGYSPYKAKLIVHKDAEYKITLNPIFSQNSSNNIPPPTSNNNIFYIASGLLIIFIIISLIYGKKKL